MKRALLAFWLIGAYATNGASAQPVETASFQPEQVELHSVVVDTPQVISLSQASPEAWDTLPSSVQLDEQLPATGQAALSMGTDHRSMVMEDRLDLFEVLGTLRDTVGACRHVLG